jgi:hypothetical protein
MAWSTISPTCGQSAPRVGIMSINPNADVFQIPISGPPPPFPYFLQANWNTGFVDAFTTQNVIAGSFSVPAPGDGSGTLSWRWENA